jgi:hypothetical protein
VMVHRISAEMWTTHLALPLHTIVYHFLTVTGRELHPLLNDPVFPGGNQSLQGLRFRRILSDL